MKNRIFSNAAFLSFQKHSSVFHLCIMIALNAIAHPTAATALSNNIIINEVQIAGSNVNDEFIELYNSTNSDIDISGWQIKKRTASGTESSLKTISSGVTLPPKGYFLWANTNGIFAPLSNQTSTTSLSDNYSIGIFDNHDTLIDAVTYGSNTHPFSPSILYSENPQKGTSIERDVANNIFLSRLQPNPQNNSFISVPSTPKKNDANKNTVSETIRINEILPHPEDGEEFIELFNFGNQPINMKNWSLHDGSKTGEYIFEEDVVIPAQGYLTLLRSTFSFALNDSEETLTLYRPDNTAANKVHYAKSKEGLSYNFSSNAWRWSKTPTPNTENNLENPLKIKTKIPKHIYPDIPAEFSVSIVSNENHNDSEKYTWDFGDGHKSHIAQPKHTFDKAGTYYITLTASNDTDEITEIFTVKAGKYPSKNLSIEEINPDPIGIDSGNESITIQNTGRKKINLLGWSIATGTSKKKLFNHPIKDSISLKSGEVYTLTHDDAAFSLPNKTGFIEIRQPNKKVVGKVSYNKTKEVNEGSIYQKTSEKSWQWSTNDNTDEKEKGEETGIAINTSEDASIINQEEASAEHPNKESQSRKITVQDLSEEELSNLEARIEERIIEKIRSGALKIEMSPVENQDISDASEEDTAQEKKTASNEAAPIHTFIQDTSLALRSVISKILLR